MFEGISYVASIELQPADLQIQLLYVITIMTQRHFAAVAMLCHSRIRTGEVVASTQPGASQSRLKEDHDHAAPLYSACRKLLCDTSHTNI
jgi:hypothetical protein